MPQNEGYVTTQDGVRLFFKVVGNGSKTLVIPNAVHLYEDFKVLAEDRSVIFYDLRNRGRSDAVSDSAKLQKGIHNDVDDIEVIRTHFSLPSFDLLGHSYLGLVVALYAMEHPSRVRRLIQIGASPPFADRQYPAHLTGADEITADVSARIAELQKEGPGGDPVEFGKRVWSIMRRLFVVNPADVEKISSPGDLPNESFLKASTYFAEFLFPSMQRLHLTAEDFAKAMMPVLLIHGVRDRQCPYGGALDWARLLPNARLVGLQDAAHLPWIENREGVFEAIRNFLNGDSLSA